MKRMIKGAVVCLLSLSVLTVLGQEDDKKGKGKGNGSGGQSNNSSNVGKPKPIPPAPGQNNKPGHHGNGPGNGNWNGGGHGNNHGSGTWNNGGHGNNHGSGTWNNDGHGNYHGNGGWNNGDWGNGHGNGSWNGGGDNVYDYDSDEDYVAYTCAPELVESNVVKTDRLIKTLLKDERFANSTQFKHVASEILKIKSDSAKLAAYFSLVGVVGTQDIFYFIGAREDDYDRYESHLISTTSLDTKLADIVVSKLLKSLKSNL